MTLQPDDTIYGGDDVSEADEHFELAPEDPERAVLNKGTGRGLALYNTVCLLTVYYT